MPGSSTTKVVGPYDPKGASPGWKIRVKAAPEKGKANAELCKFLAKLLDIRSAEISVVTGTSSRDKIVAIENVSQADVEARLAAACAT